MNRTMYTAFGNEDNLTPDVNVKEQDVPANEIADSGVFTATILVYGDSEDYGIVVIATSRKVAVDTWMGLRSIANEMKEVVF